MLVHFLNNFFIVAVDMPVLLRNAPPYVHTVVRFYTTPVKLRPNSLPVPFFLCPLSTLCFLPRSP